MYPSVSKCQISGSCSLDLITKINILLIFSRHQVIQNFHPHVMFVLNYSCLSSYSRFNLCAAGICIIFRDIQRGQTIIYGHWSCWFLSSIKQECAALIIMSSVIVRVIQSDSRIIFYSKNMNHIYK